VGQGFCPFRVLVRRKPAANFVFVFLFFSGLVRLFVFSCAFVRRAGLVRWFRNIPDVK